MNGKKKFMILGLLLVAALSLFLNHFWSYTVCALGKAVALGIVVLLVLSKFAAGIVSIRLLSFLL